MYAAVTTTINLNNNKKASVTTKNFKPPESSISTTATGTLPKAGYLGAAKNIKAYMESNGRSPSYATTKIGKVNYPSLIYTYAKIINFYKKNGRLPNYVQITSAKMKELPQGEGVIGPDDSSRPIRPVYLASDIIDGKARDLARLSQLEAILKKMGVPVLGKLVDPDAEYHISAQFKGDYCLAKIQYNCAGTIYGYGTNYFKKIRANRPFVYINWSPKTKLENLKWLPRAWDDNFSPPKFKGIACPYQYLLAQGITVDETRDLKHIAVTIYNLCIS